MTRERKLELLERTFGIRHKLKVHESMKLPDNHEELARVTLAKWELEDELAAIEAILVDVRGKNLKEKRTLIEKEGLPAKRKKP